MTVLFRKTICIVSSWVASNDTYRTCQYLSMLYNWKNLIESSPEYSNFPGGILPGMKLARFRNFDVFFLVVFNPPTQTEQITTVKTVTCRKRSFKNIILSLLCAWCIKFIGVHWCYRFFCWVPLHVTVTYGGGGWEIKITLGVYFFSLSHTHPHTLSSAFGEFRCFHFYLFSGRS